MTKSNNRNQNTRPVTPKRCGACAVLAESPEFVDVITERRKQTPREFFTWFHQNQHKLWT